MTIQQQIEVLLAQPSNRHILHSSEGRKRLATQIVGVTNYFSTSEMIRFVEEMEGLNLSSALDRQTFSSFLFSWINRDNT